MDDSPLKKIRQNSGDDEDRLSSLSDCVLCYVLSFLETKYVIQTSLLSKRFQNLWSSLPSLYFHCDSFRLLQNFDKFVSRVLTLRDTSVMVERFRLYRRGRIPSYLLNRIINYAMSLGVLRLDVEVTERGSYSFPEPGYFSASLRTFELKIHAELEKPFSFPKLTNLHLENVSFTHSDLLSTCPCLTELTLRYCSLRDLGILKIDSPTLTKLSISCCPHFECKVVVSTPKLASFCYSGIDWQLLSISGEPSDLEVTSLEAELLCRSDDENEKDVQSCVVKLLQTFHNAKYVTLSLDAIKVLSKFPDLPQKTSPFVNMKSLRIKARRRDCSFVMPAHVMNYLLGDPPCAQPTFHADLPCLQRWNRCPQHENCKLVWQ